MGILDAYSDDDIKRIMQAGGDNYVEELKSIKNARADNIDEFGSNKSKSMRQDLSVPPSIYWHFVRKYGKKIWDDPKFLKEFRSTLKAFRMWEKW